MSRYRTPRKKPTKWKSHLMALALGLLFVAVGIFLLVALPEEPEPQITPDPETEAAPAEPAEGGEEADPTREPAPTPSPGRLPVPDPQQTGILGSEFLGMGLILLGILIPVASVVAEKTSGKKWRRRAGKKHPFKRKF